MLTTKIIFLVNNHKSKLIRTGIVALTLMFVHHNIKSEAVNSAVQHSQVQIEEINIVPLTELSGVFDI